MDIEAIRATIKNLPQKYEPLLLTFYGSEAYLDQDLVVLGDDYGTKICLDVTDGCLYSVDPENHLSSRFLNSSIDHFAKFLVRYTEYEKQVAEAAAEEVQVQLVGKLREQFLAIDERAISGPETWWTLVLEQAKHGLL